MKLQEMILNILSNPELDDDVIEESKSELIYNLTEKYEWSQIYSILIEFLEDSGLYHYWHTITVILFQAVTDKRPIRVDYTIALLYYCLMNAPENYMDENLVWSITRNLKGVGYLSDYEPFKDSAVWEELQKIKKLHTEIG